MHAKVPKFNRRSNIMIPVIAVLTLMGSIAMVINSQKGNNVMNWYTKVPAGYLMVLRQGDNVFEKLENFAMREKVPSANFTAMGFADVTFGHFDSQAKAYKPKEFKDLELASMLGTIAWKEGKPSIHSHATAGDQNFQSLAGHVLKAIVSTGSLEIMLTVHDKRLERKTDEQLGADILEIGNN